MDARLITNNDGSFTIGVTNGDLTVDNGFDTAINLSLFTDKRAPDDRIINEKDRRGTLRDLVSTVEDRKHGSWLWLLEQSKLTPENRNLAIVYCQDALNWFVEDGIATSVEIDAVIVPRQGFQILISIRNKLGEVTNHYRNLWEFTGNAT